MRGIIFRTAKAAFKKAFRKHKSEVKRAKKVGTPVVPYSLIKSDIKRKIRGTKFTAAAEFKAQPGLKRRIRIGIERAKREKKKFKKPVIFGKAYASDKKEKIQIKPCPGDKEQKIGDFRNDKKLLRVSGYKRGQNGIECITLYEDVPFIDQYIPSFKQFTGVFSLALVGCSAPIILNLVKPLVKNFIKKLTKKKKDVE